MINTKKLAVIGILAAMSVAFMMIVRIPFPPAPFLEYDPADIPILVGAFLFGPVWGIALTLIVSIIQGLTVSAGSGIIGIVMHFAATGCFATLAGAIYKKHRTRTYAYMALILGTVVQTIIMVIMNLWLTPVFMETPRDVVLSMIVPIIIPFNLLKAGINSVVTALVYKKMHSIFKKMHLE